MDTKEDYIKELEKNMDKYKNKISKVDSLLANYNSSNKPELLNQHQSLRHKFVDCGDIIKETAYPLYSRSNDQPCKMIV